MRLLPDPAPHTPPGDRWRLIGILLATITGACGVYTDILPGPFAITLLCFAGMAVTGGGFYCLAGMVDYLPVLRRAESRGFE